MRKLMIGLLACISGLALAWDAPGHEVVAQIAFDHCLPATQTKIIALLSHAKWTTENEHGTQIVRDYTNPATAARFADDIVDAIWGKNPFSEGKQRYKEWHYLNHELSGAIEHPTGPGDVVQAINQAMWRIEGDSRAKVYKKGKLEALLFLIHFVGDAHQPLHCADSHDTGGHFNIFLPGPGNHKMMAHKWWDGEAKRVKHLTASLATVIGPSLNAALATIKGCADDFYAAYRGGFTSTQISDLKPEDWASDSFTYAKNSIYSVGNHPTQAQLDTWREAAFKDMTLAGLRLGKMFDKLAAHL